MRRNQHVSEDNDTCMIPNNPEVQRRLEDAVIDVAPGEGRRPHGLLMARDWDVRSHPRLHNADGSNGLHQENRPVRLSDQQYFKLIPVPNGQREECFECRSLHEKCFGC